jgi:hypothetical protein
LRRARGHRLVNVSGENGNEKSYPILTQDHLFDVFDVGNSLAVLTNFVGRHGGHEEERDGDGLSGQGIGRSSCCGEVGIEVLVQSCGICEQLRG